MHTVCVLILHVIASRLSGKHLKDRAPPTENTMSTILKRLHIPACLQFFVFPPDQQDQFTGIKEQNTYLSLHNKMYKGLQPKKPRAFPVHQTLKIKKE